MADGASRPLPGSTKEFWIPASAGKTEGLLGQAEFALCEEAPGRQSGGFTTGSSAGKKSIFSAPLAIQIDKQVIEGGDGSLFHVGMPILVLIQDRQAERPFMNFQ